MRVVLNKISYLELMNMSSLNTKRILLLISKQKEESHIECERTQTINKEELWVEEIERVTPAEQRSAFQYHLIRSR